MTEIKQVEQRLRVNTPEPDLSIRFIQEELGQHIYRYRYILDSPLPNIRAYFRKHYFSQLPVVQFVTEETSDKPQDILEGIFGDINLLNNQEEFFEQLNSIGTDLYERLFPRELKNLYWEILRNHVRTVLIVSDEVSIPWELIRPFHLEQGEDEFLCEKFELTRWLAGCDYPVENINLESIKLMAASNPRSARVEIDRIKEIFNSKAEDVSPYSASEIYQLFQNGGFSGLHLACHGVYNRTSPDASKLYLNKKCTLKPRDINGNKRRFGKDRPFVFLNACETARGGPALIGIGGWAEAFIKRATSSGFIGSTWKARDDSALLFAISFYQELLKGEAIGKATQTARNKIKRSGDPTWLSYVVYANPLARLNVNN